MYAPRQAITHPNHLLVGEPVIRLLVAGLNLHGCFAEGFWGEACLDCCISWWVYMDFGCIVTMGQFWPREAKLGMCT